MEELGSLVRRSHAGDLEAFGQVVARFQDMAYGYAYSLLGDFHLAEDAAQEAFLEAYRCLGNLREPAAFPGWFRRIVFKQCDRLTRGKHAPTVPLEQAGDVASGDSGPARAAEAGEMKDRVLRAIQSLPDHERAVTTLFYINGYSQADIAEFLEVPEGTIKSRLNASRRRLRERMMAMVDETLKSFPLPARFAEVVMQMRFVADRVRPLAARMAIMTTEQMQNSAADLARRLKAGEPRDTIKAEAFALACESCHRALGIVPYDVQLVAALILDEGWIAEEPSGEGKSISCLPAIFMAAVEGRRVHVVTVNDYLARRDAALAEKVLGPLGVSVASISAEMPPRSPQRRQAYQHSVVYATAAELALDSIRDVSADPSEEPIPLPPDVAILDEADSILLDEAATVVMVAAESARDPELYRRADAVARQLIERDAPSEAKLFTVDPAHQWDILLTAAGEAALKEMSAATAAGNPPAADSTSQVRQSLRAHVLYGRDREYVVQDGRVVIVDEGTGRPLANRRWSDGLHQAIEVKEGVPITAEKSEKASVRIGAYFRRYRKLAGITGTAASAAEEFKGLYGLDAAVVPTRSPINRVDHDDRVYRNRRDEYRAIVEEVRHYSVDLGRPVLVGTTGIRQSQQLSDLLRDAGIEHEILDARPEHAAREAQIVATVGRQRTLPTGRQVGAVTVSTSMAGRGTDIEVAPKAILDHCRVPKAEDLAGMGVREGEPFPPGSAKCCIYCQEYDEATNCGHCFKPRVDPAFPARGRTACRREVPCGLYVIGLGRQSSRRLDDQLRNRAGRAGLPGSSRFFLSLEDELLAADPAAAVSLASSGQEFIEGLGVSKAIRELQATAAKNDARIRQAILMERQA